MDGGSGGAVVAAAPPLDDWVRSLRRCGAVGAPGERAPLVLDGTRLYLHRYWEYERDLAGWIARAAALDDEPVDEALLSSGLARLFPAGDGGGKEPDRQRIAACAAVLRRFSVISGGPGTGKTTTTARLLALLIEQAGGAGARIALAAPTGKAAARMQEAVGKAAAALGCGEETRRAIPREASTIHRLLGPLRGSPRFRHGAGNPLPFDTVVVDEASMVDLALMCKLVRALPPHARLVLIGDKDQLASVEAGAVLGDICGFREATLPAALSRRVEKIAGCSLPAAPREKPHPAPIPCIVTLRRNYRFRPASGIAALAGAVREGDATRAVALLARGDMEDVVLTPPPPAQRLAAALRGRIVEGFGPCLAAAGLGEKLALLDRFRILTPLRRGPRGVEGLNALVEEVLAAEGLIDPALRWYEGRPLLVLKNDHALRLFNGDAGIVLPDPAAGGGLRAFFPTAGGGAPRRLLPLRLPEHETVFATTVHKSQGSEYERVLLLMPERDTPLLTRELLYTALTRARGRVEIVSSPDVIAAAVSRGTRRASGLRRALWGDEEGAGGAGAPVEAPP
jgi:exodeoxyribonuclease V alpha subunit